MSRTAAPGCVLGETIRMKSSTVPHFFIHPCQDEFVSADEAAVRAAVDRTSGCEHVPPAVESPTCGISWNNNLGLGGTKKNNISAGWQTQQKPQQPSFHSEVTQRFSNPSVAFSFFLAGRASLHLLGLDHRTCCDVYWLTHCSQAAGPDGEDTNRSGSNQSERLFCKRVSWTEAEQCSRPSLGFCPASCIFLFLLLCWFASLCPGFVNHMRTHIYLDFALYQLMKSK